MAPNLGPWIFQAQILCSNLGHNFSLLVVTHVNVIMSIFFYFLIFLKWRATEPEFDNLIQFHLEHHILTNASLLVAWIFDITTSAATQRSSTASYSIDTKLLTTSIALNTFIDVCIMKSEGNSIMIAELFSKNYPNAK